jgi:large subunit ribosomal protein L23
MQSWHDWGDDMEMRNILVRSLVIEKSTSEVNEENNTYVFEVGLKANKAEIKNAIEQYFSVSVEDVRTLIVRGKEKRFGRFMGKRSNWKKAYIRLAAGDSIDLYGEE